MKRISFIFLGLIIVWVSVVSAEVITFDDVPGVDPIIGYDVVPDGYGGLNWDNFYVAHKTYHETNYPGSGYVNGIVSGEWVAFNGYAKPALVSGTQFDFNGAYFTAARNNDLQIDVKGYLNGSLLYSRTITVDYTSPTWFDFDFLGIDKLQFNSYGGVDAGLGSGSGANFVMDNLTINNNSSPSSVPEPSTIILLITSFVGMRALKKLHRK